MLEQDCCDTTCSTCLPVDLSKLELAGLLLVNILALYLGIMQQQVLLTGILSVHLFSAWLHQCGMTATRSVLAIKNSKDPLDVDLQVRN